MFNSMRPAMVPLTTANNPYLPMGCNIVLGQEGSSLGDNLRWFATGTGGALVGGGVASVTAGLIVAAILAGITGSPEVGAVGFSAAGVLGAVAGWNVAQRIAGNK